MARRSRASRSAGAARPEAAEASRPRPFPEAAVLLPASEPALRRHAERQALALHAAGEGVWDWDPAQDVLHCSSAWAGLCGRPPQDSALPLEHWLADVHEDDRPRVRTALLRHLAGESDGIDQEVRIRHATGTERWIRMRGLAYGDAGGRPARVTGTLSDVTQDRIAEERRRHDAFHDRLTGLPNRALFLDRLERSLWRARRHAAYRFAVVFLGLDRVKLVNDSLGHRAGDRLLVVVARRIEECLRASDSAARMGGDEFAVLIDDLSDPADAIRVVSRIQDALRAPVALDEDEVFATASIGVAFFGEGYERADEMMRDASTAACAAKAAGGARCQIFDQAMHDRAVERLRIETALRRAVERDELRAHYQPMVSLGTGELVGFEALLRWQHPERGLVPPAEFVPIAEETGLIVDLDRWILREACTQMARWTRELVPGAQLSVSVNLSGRQLAEPDLVLEVVRALEESELEPARLRLEITESAVMRDPGAAAQSLSQLRALGVGVSLDDFGTGYSSLAYLQRLPLTVLKIDRSFVQGMGEQVRDRQICQAIVALAHGLGLAVVAEGIETPVQRERLLELQCDYGQGYHFARPLPADEAAKLLARGSLG